MNSYNATSETDRIQLLASNLSYVISLSGNGLKAPAVTGQGAGTRSPRATA